MSRKLLGFPSCSATVSFLHDAVGSTETDFWKDSWMHIDKTLARNTSSICYHLDSTSKAIAKSVVPLRLCCDTGWGTLLMFALYRTAVPFARNLVGNSNVASHGHVSSGLKPSRWMLGMSMTTSSKRKLPEGVEKIIKVKKGPEKPETFWSRFLGPKPMPERHTAAWYREVALICTVFGITGSSTMMLVSWCDSTGVNIRSIYISFYLTALEGSASCKGWTWSRG